MNLVQEMIDILMRLTRRTVASRSVTYVRTGGEEGFHGANLARGEPAPMNFPLANQRIRSNESGPGDDRHTDEADSPHSGFKVSDVRTHRW